MTDKLTLASDKPRDQDASDISEAGHSEDRMRRALEQLGGGSSAARTHHAPPSAHDAFNTTRKHRFVQDGDVQVTHAQVRRDRGVRAQSPPPEIKLNGAQDALAEERGLRQRAERVAQDAQAMIATLQTKLRHGEIALGEARDAIQAHAEATAKFQAELHASDEQIKSLQIQLAATEAERDRLDQTASRQSSFQQSPQAYDLPPVKVPAVRASITKATPARKISRLTRSVAQIQKSRDPNAEEPQPVKWWLGEKE